ncbi:MAG: hypothetical protein RJA07_2814 [Bacteroidota bacterium]|jgi:hypothetical protein
MQNSKLIILLKTFSPQETHRFRLYLQSPYHNTNPLFYQLFEAIRPFLHSRNREIINGENIFALLIKSAKSKSTSKFNNLQFNLWCSALYKLAANFVVLNQTEINSNDFSLKYLQVLNQRKLTDLFVYHAQKTKLLIAKSKHLQSKFYDEFFLQQQINAYQEILQSRTEPRNTADVLTSLENFYLHQKLKYWSAVLHYKKMFDQPVEILWEDFLLEYLQKNKMADEQIEINRQILLLEQATDAKPYYQWLKSKLTKAKNNLPLATKKEIYLFLINYCIAQINLGELNFYKEIFEIYKLALQQDLLIQQKTISPWDFKNIITVALQQKEISWAEKFIKTYSLLLPKDELENAYHYNLARVFFIQKKYNESLKLSQQVAYTDIFYQLDIKLMQAKTLYELNELDTLDDLISSFKKMLNRKRRLSKHYQTIYGKFLLYLQKILKLNNSKSVPAIIKQLSSDTLVPDKNWLMEKLNSIQ